MGKITCATCASEFKRKCNAKKGRPSVSINKRRRCDKYIMEASKVKERHIIKSIPMGYKQREAMRAEYKLQAKEAKLAAKEGRAPQNISHPVTGDLSRFTSTAGGGNNNRGG
jgi:hypothetical protein